MPSLWRTVYRRWLESRPPPGIDHLCDHLRRDIGIADGDLPHHAAPRSDEPIRDRIISQDRSFSVLHETR